MAALTHVLASIQVVHVTRVKVGGPGGGAQRDVRGRIGPQGLVAQRQRHRWNLVHVHHDGGLVGAVGRPRGRGRQESRVAVRVVEIILAPTFPVSANYI